MADLTPTRPQHTTPFPLDIGRNPKGSLGQPWASLGGGQVSLPCVNFGPRFARQRVKKRLAHLQQDRVQVDEEAVRGRIGGVHVHSGSFLCIALQAKRYPLQHRLPCILHLPSLVVRVAYTQGPRGSVYFNKSQKKLGLFKHCTIYRSSYKNCIIVPANYRQSP